MYFNGLHRNFIPFEYRKDTDSFQILFGQSLNLMQTTEHNDTIMKSVQC